MTDRLILNWKLDGFVDEQRYYCSETPINPQNLPAPKVVLAGDVRTYTDAAITVGRTYHVLIGSMRNGIEKLSEQKSVAAESTPIPLSFISADTTPNADTGATTMKINVPAHKAGDIIVICNGFQNVETAPTGWLTGYAYTGFRAAYYRVAAYDRLASIEEISMRANGVVVFVLRPAVHISRVGFESLANEITISGAGENKTYTSYITPTFTPSQNLGFFGQYFNFTNVFAQVNSVSDVMITPPDALKASPRTPRNYTMMTGVGGFNSGLIGESKNSGVQFGGYGMKSNYNPTSTTIRFLNFLVKAFV